MTKKMLFIVCMAFGFTLCALAYAGDPVFVNEGDIVHKDSSGATIAFPDVCKTPTPGGPVPIPYPNIGKSSDTSKGSKKVKADGKTPSVKGGKYSTSSGDEPNVGSGYRAKPKSYTPQPRTTLNERRPTVKNPLREPLGSPQGTP
jgi:hypothetical protein